MICKFCGSKVEKGVPCPNCGAMQHLEEEEQVQAQQPVQPNGLQPDGNGAYHWEYRTTAFSNPSTLIYLLWFVFAFGVFMALVQLMLWAGDGCGGDILGTLIFVGKCTAGLLVGSVILWVILMLLKGPVLNLRYTMNEKEISYLSDPVRNRKQKIGYAAFSDQLTYDGRVPTKWERPVSAFWRVKKIRTVRKKNLIWVNVFMQKSTIFVPQEHYDFVCEYITSRCPNAKIKKPKQK